ncbi:MAG TPA: TIGR03905 family TSCPD domain-containing protein [Anaerovoracaceae bacterium]|nr:TIGR03905 family TSCPD domain-containing protein [Anaerovoracaceae bacterium]
MTFIYKTHGTCASQIELELEGNILKKVKFIDGCDGNSQGIARLAEGMTVEEIKKRLTGIQCEGGPTSCPDQLVKAVEEALKLQK